MVNPETGEPLLQVGIAYKHLRDKMKKESADYLHTNHFTGWKQTYSTRSDDTVAHQMYYNTNQLTLLF